MNAAADLWVEIEMLAGDACNCYNCRISRADYEQIAIGCFEKPFIRVYDIHWYRDNEDDEWKPRKLIEYGTNNRSEYASEAMLRVDQIIGIFTLKHGPIEPS